MSFPRPILAAECRVRTEDKKQETQHTLDVERGEGNTTSLRLVSSCQADPKAETNHGKEVEQVIPPEIRLRNDSCQYPQQYRNAREPEKHRQSRDNRILDMNWHIAKVRGDILGCCPIASAAERW
jgi:hypothetical protein